MLNSVKWASFMTDLVKSESDAVSRIVALSKDVERLTLERDNASKKLADVVSENESVKEDKVRCCLRGEEQH